ncbi:MAG TPA: uracil-DNA glycosylase [Casimicrobiaceae bacterium]|nr:uracil-DNA glycosylase [Casimicrobiaceae bacterium]
MADRDDILTELGLTPVWRLRASAQAVALDVEAIHDAPPDGRRDASLARRVSSTRDASPTEAVSTPNASDARLDRIARIEWRDFAADVDACTACGLCRARRKSVPGVGDAHAEWLFIGEAPGAEEDARGEPFVGQAGKLLDNMLAALGMNRGENVYIANVLKCRPPNNRTPEPLEVDSCRPYLDRQIALIEPKIIVALGKSAATTLLGVDASIASLRGRVHRYRGVPLVVTYHPAYLLRNLPDKSKAWEDLLFARRTLRAADASESPQSGTLKL